MVSTAKEACCGVKSRIGFCMCAAMDTTAEPDYSSVLPDVNPAETHHQVYRVYRV